MRQFHDEPHDIHHERSRHHHGWHARARGGHPGGRGHGGFEGERGGRGGGRRRMFEAGELRLVLLRLLEDHPRHGYDFIRELETQTGGAYAPSPGVIYPTLTLLEELGHVAALATEGAKRLFNITAEGRAHLEEHRAEVDLALERLKHFGAEHSWFESGPVWRAMQNLKTVLHGRLSSGVDKQALFQVAELIDEAARKIERLEVTPAKGKP